MRQSFTSFIDYFHPPFRSLMPVETFRYAACGGINTLMGLLLYYIGYQHLFARRVFDFGFYAFEPHVAALFLSSSFSFCFGFLLNKYVVFTSSNLRGRIQLFRYFLSFAFNLVLNYVMLKLLVDYFEWDVMISQVFTILIVITMSYLSQKHFSFKVKR